MILTFDINKQLILRTDCEIPVAKSENYLFAQFSFSEEWQGIKTAIFNNGTAYSLQLDDNNSCFVPWEVITDSGFYVSVFCGERITANKVFVKVLPSGYVEGETPKPPSPTVYDQIMDDINALKNGKQNKLTAGDGITIKNDVISSQGGGVKNYAELLGLPRTLYNASTSNVNITAINDGIYDAGNTFTLVSDGNTVTIEKGAIFAINRNNNNIYGLFINSPEESGILLKSASGTTGFSFIDLLNYDFSDFVTSAELSAEETARQNADNDLQGQIDAITVSSDVIDVVRTYADLQNYDTQHVKANDIIKVMQDSTHGDATSYYRWVITSNVGAWVYVGSEGPYYTKAETNELLQGKADTSDLANYATKSYVDTEDAKKVDTQQGTNNVGKGLRIDTLGNVSLSDDPSIDFLSALPQSDIKDNTNYLTRATRPTINYGNYCSNKVLYPTSDLPTWTAPNTLGFIIYNSDNQCFYYFAQYYQNYVPNEVNYIWVDDTTDELKINGNWIRFTCYKYDTQNPNGWEQVSSPSSGEGHNKNITFFALSDVNKFKFVWASDDITFRVGLTDYIVTDDTDYIDTDGYIYADFFSRTTGAYKDNDLDNVNDSDIFNFIVNARRNNAWVEVGKYNLQWLADQFAKAAALTAETTARQAADTALQNGKQDALLTFSNITVATSDFISDSTYPDYPYKAILSCPDVTSSMQANVYLNTATAMLGIVATPVQEGTDSVTIWCKTNDTALTIDKVVVF